MYMPYENLSLYTYISIFVYVWYVIIHICAATLQVVLFKSYIKAWLIASVAIHSATVWRHMYIYIYLYFCYIYLYMHIYLDYMNIGIFCIYMYSRSLSTPQKIHHETWNDVGPIALVTVKLSSSRLRIAQPVCGIWHKVGQWLKLF